VVVSVPAAGASDGDRRTTPCVQAQGIGGGKSTYKSRHSFCRAKARERKGMICACFGARSDHRSKGYFRERGAIEPAEQ
jgi:hypothetical protein